MNKKFIITSLVLVWLTFSFLDDLVDDWGQIEDAPEKLETFFYADLWPPDWSVLEVSGNEFSFGLTGADGNIISFNSAN